MAGQLPEGETAARRPGVAACVGERQACIHPRGWSGLRAFAYMLIFMHSYAPNTSPSVAFRAQIR